MIAFGVYWQHKFSFLAIKPVIFFRLNGQVTKIKGKIYCLGCKIEFGEVQWNIYGYQNGKYVNIYVNNIQLGH